MAKFTQEERNALRALFTLEEHEIREGGANKTKTKIQWFVYLRREAIQERLDDLFFGEWELYFVDPQQPCIYHKEHVDCSMGLAVRGMRREYNGSQDGGGLNGAKGAATDAIKRVASMWGIGLYMQNAPQIWTDNYVTYEVTSDGKVGKPIKTDYDKKNRLEKEVMGKIGAWLKSLGAAGNSLYTAPSQDDESPSAGEPFVPPTPSNVSQADFKPEEKKADNGGEKVTATITKVDVKLSKNGNSRHIVAGGITFFGRDVFRALGYDAPIIEKLDKVGAVTLPDGIQIVYKVDGDNFKQPLRVKRLGTNAVISMDEVKKKAAGE